MDHLCERHAAGDMTYAPLLRGDVEQIVVAKSEPLPDRSRAEVLLRIEQVNLCLYRECATGCTKSQCWAKRKGIHWRSEPFTEVLMSECVSCMGDTVTAKEGATS